MVVAAADDDNSLSPRLAGKGSLGSRRQFVNLVSGRSALSSAVPSASSSSGPRGTWKPSTQRLQGVTDWARYASNRAAEPPLPLCQAAGLEVTVRSWWRGAPGRKDWCLGNSEDKWIRQACAGGGQEGAHELLKRSGIPQIVVESGLQLSLFILQDKECRDCWRRCLADEANFVPCIVERMFQRFEILAKVPWNNDVPQDAPCLLLTPRPVTKEHNRSGSRYAPTSSLSSRKRGISPPPQDPFSPPPQDPLSKSVIGADLLSGRASAPQMCGFSREDMYLKQRAADLASFVSPLATAGSSSMRRDRGSSPPSPISAPSPAPLSAQSSNLASVRHGLKDVSSRMHPHPAALKTSEDHVVQKPKERDRPWRTPKGAAPTITREESNFDLWLMQNGRRKEPEVEVKQTKQEASEFLKSMTSSVGIMKPKANVIRDIAEVRRIFGQFDEDQSGLLEPHEFVDLLARLMRLPKNSMDMDQVWRHWEAVDIDGGGTITFDEFQKWYCGAFSIEHPDFRDFFTKDIDLEEDDIMVRNVAKKLHMCVTDIEKLWKTFTRLDSNKSGKLEFEEFKELIEKQLKPELSRFSTTAEVPSTIYKKFWVELDPLGSGSVAFPDFAAWYVSFFKDDEVSPMERYYNLLAKRPGHHG